MKAFAILAAGSLLLAACADGTGGTANRVVQIGNNTGVTMDHFYASNTKRETWEEDIFDGKPLKNGQTVNVDIDDGSGACLFDLRADFADGDIVVEKGFNVCRQGSWFVR